MPLILGANSITGGYEVANSLRFNSGSSDHLSKTFGTTQSDGKKITISSWCKLGTLGTTRYFFGTSADGSYSNEIGFNTNNKLEFFCINNATNGVTTSRVFRDVSAWYHVVAVLDTTQATSTDRIKIYVNGVQETAFDSTNYPSLNAVTEFVKNGGATRVGDKGSGGNYYDGYLAEFCVLDGQALDPTSFGEFDEDTGIWKPIDVSGLTFGTNGFYLDFEDSSALGDDVSGNGNDFTVNNLTSIDQTTDTPTNNFATMNALGGYGTFSEGNLKFVTSTTDGQWGTSTISLSSGGKWYCEVKMIATDDKYQVGLTNSNAQEFTYRVVYRSDGAIYVGGSSTSGHTTYTTNDIIGMAFDSSNREITFYKNGSSVQTVTAPALASSVPQDYFFGATSLASGTLTTEWNYGNPPYTISSGNSDGNGYGNFEYSVPSGYYALNSKNLAEYG
jgi:hypothetical protein